MSSDIDSFVDTLEEDLRDFIDSETSRVTNERDFLLNVLHGRTDSVAVEDASTDLTNAYLTGYLSQFVTIDDSG